MAEDRIAIERPLTASDEKGLINPKARTPAKVFVEKLHAEEQRCTQEHIPFDRVCARFEFEQKLAAVRAEIEHTETAVNDQDKRLFAVAIDIASFAKPDRFNKVLSSDEIIPRIVDGMQLPTKVGITEIFVCKQRGHKIAVFVPNEALLKREKKEMQSLKN